MAFSGAEKSDRLRGASCLCGCPRTTINARAFLKKCQVRSNPFAIPHELVRQATRRRIMWVDNRLGASLRAGCDFTVKVTGFLALTGD